MELTSLEIAGHKDQRVPNTFFRQEKETTHLGIVLPGYRYSVDRAELYYASRILLEQGADLFRVEYAYNQTNFMQVPESEQDNWISNDVFAACNICLLQRSYEKITLIGKSLGTIAMDHLLTDSRFQNATCVWSTPMLTVEWLPKRIEQVKPRSLFIVGTADNYYKPEILEKFVEATRGRVTKIDRATHALEIPNNIIESLDVLNRIVKDLQEFLT